VSDVKINGMNFISARYPAGRVGTFECSDPLLNRIWEMCALTQSANMEDAYDDCVDRERGLYAFDALIQYHVNLVCFGDHKLMKRTLELFGQSAHGIGLFRCLYPNTGDYILPDFCLYIVNAFQAYNRETRDTELMRRYWPAIMTNLRVFNKLSDERPDKLLCADPPAGRWPRNPEDNRTGFIGDGSRTDNTGINCLFSCLYLMTLRNAHEIAAATGAEDEADLTERIAVLEKSIPEAFWNEEKGLFADTLTHEKFSPHASLYAVNADVVSEERCERLRANLPPLLLPFFKNGYNPDDGVAFETSVGFYMLQGLYKLGLAETAERCIKEGWGYFLTKGLKTVSEHFTLNSSQCHAWSASPAYMLTRYVLGAQYDSRTGQVSVNPQPGTLTWAKGTLPSPNGLVNVEWRLEDGSRYKNLIVDM
jgi:hypothetical protein